MVPATPSAKTALMEEMLVSPVVENTDMPSVKAPNPVRSSFNSPSAERANVPFTLIPVPAPPARASVLEPSTFRFPVKKEFWNMVTMSKPVMTVLEKEMAWSTVLP